MFPYRGARAGGRWPWVTLGLIALNVAVHLYLLHVGPDAADALFLKGGAVPAKLSQFRLFSFNSLKLLSTMFSSLFLHLGWVHLLGNMWFLWVFGEGLEDDLGHFRFLGFYLFTGFFAVIFHILAAGNISAPLIGASGAIAGVLGGYLARFPRGPIKTLFLFRLRWETLEVPAYVWLGVWLALQFWGLKNGGAVAWVAHLGGFFTGLLTVSLFTPLRSAASVNKPAVKRKRQPAKRKKK